MKGRFSGETNPPLLSQDRGPEAVLGEVILNESLFLHEPIKPQPVYHRKKTPLTATGLLQQSVLCDLMKYSNSLEDDKAIPSAQKTQRSVARQALPSAQLRWPWFPFRDQLALLHLHSFPSCLFNFSCLFSPQDQVLISLVAHQLPSPLLSSKINPEATPAFFNQLPPGRNSQVAKMLQTWGKHQGPRILLMLLVPVPYHSLQLILPVTAQAWALFSFQIWTITPYHFISRLFFVLFCF